MASQRLPSSMGRPVSRSGFALPSGARLPSAGRPPSTAIRVGTGVAPGTGVRGGASIPTAGVLSAPIKVTERPVTQQGLSGMKTGMKGPQRQIQDKTYFLGLLRSKINELTAEMSKLHKEIDNYNQENSVYLSYEKRAEDLAQEIKDLQGKLADYNMLVDKLNTNTETEEMISEYNIVKAKNDCEAERIDQIFTDRRGLEEAVRDVDQEIKREQRATHEIVRAMPAVKQEKYFSIMAASEQLLQELAVLQEELDILNKRRQDYESELSHSHIKQEMIRLHEMLTVLEVKRDAMLAEEKILVSPQEEREKLFKQVKDDNQEIASMERQLTELREKTGRISEEIHQLDQAESQGEHWQKYKELKKREEEIDRFLCSFEKSRAEEQEEMSRTEENIVSLLELCSRNMMRLRHVDTVTASELRNMQDVLVSKETEVVQSKSTASGLATETERLQQDLEKVQQLEGKIQSELSSLKERISTMESELTTYSDLDRLRHAADKKKKRLQEERQLLTQRREFFKQLLKEMSEKYEALKRKLQENETHAQLSNLERKWQHLEQNNFVMKEFISSKTQESDYNSVTTTVYQQVSDYNKLLIQLLQNA
ncbi:intraflagellar transport protein 74 homolog isoform X1 [Takifugu rubripes]|uniref:intraflagellar transport protein 74 homolog isoform X1 n=1 Tax=Takifugu rubripes TaxID=31033 RepID=UPI00029901B6|nr:intraflagellar transport protein 74 homolog isoform X1 [Takifugu rubripes]|eukprot:XP_003968254.1 PREDICTED: intraflagellar transport protein 74 homolog [Takifugu rubripes]